MTQSSLRDLAQGERAVAEAWRSEGQLHFHRAHLREALRLELLALHTEGQLTAAECATAVVMVETWNGDLDELLAATRDVLR